MFLHVFIASEALSMYNHLELILIILEHCFWFKIQIHISAFFPVFQSTVFQFQSIDYTKTESV